jgi:hypothetical protein
MREAKQAYTRSLLVLLLLLPSNIGRAAEVVARRAMLIDGVTVPEGAVGHGSLSPEFPLAASCTAVPYCSVQVPPSTGACEGHPATPRSQNITYYLEDAGTGQPVPNCPVAVEYFAYQPSGGHCHTDVNRPVEYPAGPVPRIVTGNTGADGLQFVVTNTWPEASGGINVRFYSTDPGCPFYNDPTVSFILCVQVAQFAELGETADYDTVGAKPEHLSSHFGTTKLLAVLPQLAAEFSQSFPSVNLGFNDMSLPWGGVFDLGETWQADPVLGHCGHRVGTTVDVRTNNLNKDQRKKLRELLRAYKFGIFFHSTHWHCTLR